MNNTVDTPTLEVKNRVLIDELTAGDKFVFLTVKRGVVVPSDTTYEFVGFSKYTDHITKKKTLQDPDHVIYVIPGQNKEYITRLRNVIKIQD